MAKGTCTVADCARTVSARGMCTMHYQRWRKYGDPSELKRNRNPPETCSVDGCGDPHHGLGWCVKHYFRWKNTGTTTARVAVNGSGCAVDGCQGRARSRGWCTMHYTRWLRNGDPLLVQRVRSHPEECTVDGCTRKWRSNGMCKTHAQADWATANRDAANEIRRRRRARIRGNGTFLITPRDISRIMSSPCLACGARIDVQVDHVIPIARGGTHSVGNLAPLCKTCNASKNALTWMEWRISSRPKSPFTSAA